jgi:hypothetical protein
MSALRKNVVLFSPWLPRAKMQRSIDLKKVIFTEYGREKLCTRCNTYWPFDTEFYVPTMPHCRACESDRKKGYRSK